MSLDYRQAVARTANIKPGHMNSNLCLGGLGVVGEAGEVADLIKKCVFHDKPLDQDKLIKEMGDVYWYLEYLCIVIGVDREEVMRRNNEKLRARFPNGFNSADANAKRDEHGSV